MDYLPQQNKLNLGDQVPSQISAKDKHVIILGGGDTGADCLGTAHRQGARDVHQLELMPTPPDSRAADNPWPQWPQIFRVSTAHEEGGERLFAVSTQRFSSDETGHVRALHALKVEMVHSDGRVQFQPVPGSEFEIPADLVLLAMGFVGPERGPLVNDLGLKLTDRGNIWRDARWMTNVPGVFTAGDMQRGQSLIVWAIAEGRSAARGIDQFLTGDSKLPAPLA
jgi:glutamate synthase (NADPH/NADH) small chain